VEKNPPIFKKEKTPEGANSSKLPQIGEIPDKTEKSGEKKRISSHLQPSS